MIKICIHVQLGIEENNIKKISLDQKIGGHDSLET